MMPDPDKLVRFGQLMRSNITNGEVPFCNAHLRSLIDAVEVDQRVVRTGGARQPPVARRCFLRGTVP